MEDVKPDTTPEVKEPVAELDAPEIVEDEPLVEPEEPRQPERVPHPLAPGGKRFEQIYAGKKHAERENAELRERLLSAEAKIEVLVKGGTQPPASDGFVEYGWPELEGFIQQGRLTRAEAEAHREEVLERKVTRKIESRQDHRTKETTREQYLDQTIQAYLGAVPAILNEASPDRVRLDEEFDYVATIQGLDPETVTGAQRKALQATALRNVYGPIDSVSRRASSVKRETQQELGGSTKPTLKPNPDQALLNKLSKAEVEHYTKMFKSGRYPNKWKDVVEELKFVKPGRSQ